MISKEYKWFVYHRPFPHFTHSIRVCTKRTRLWMSRPPRTGSYIPSVCSHVLLGLEHSKFPKFRFGLSYGSAPQWFLAAQQSDFHSAWFASLMLRHKSPPGLRSFPTTTSFYDKTFKTLDKHVSQMPRHLSLPGLSSERYAYTPLVGGTDVNDWCGSCSGPPCYLPWWARRLQQEMLRSLPSSRRHPEEPVR